MLNKLIKIFSCIIILLGIVHIGFAFPLEATTYTLWFVGAGMAIIYSGLLNLVMLQNNGSRLTKTVATITNSLNCLGFCFAIPILNQPQVYVGAIIFLIPAICFLIKLTSHH